MRDLELRIRRFLGDFIYATSDDEAACEKCFDQFSDAEKHLREEHPVRYLLSRLAPKGLRPSLK